LSLPDNIGETFLNGSGKVSYDEDWIPQTVANLKSRIRLMRMHLGFIDNPVVTEPESQEQKPAPVVNKAANDLRSKLKGKTR